MPKLDIQGLGEIDEEDVRASVTLRRTLNSWMKNPASKRKLLEAHRAFDPKADIPELDQPDPVEARVTPVANELAELRKEMKADREARDQEKSLSALTASIDRGIEKLRRDQGLTEEGIAGVRKIMEEEGITKPEIAWAHFQQLHPPQPLLQPSRGGGWNFMEPPPDDQVDLKKLIETRGDNDMLVNKMVNDTLADLRGTRR